MPLTEIALRLLSATLIGAAVGLDREVRRKAAGLRTHALVALGASLLVVVILRQEPQTFEHVDALARVIQGIMAGIGFLGGGAILKSSGANEQEAVHGLTTATSIWVVAALGMACGAGQWVAASIAGLLTVIVLVFGWRVDRFIKNRFPLHHEDR